jgi:hypothetical protein
VPSRRKGSAGFWLLSTRVITDGDEDANFGHTSSGLGCVVNREGEFGFGTRMGLPDLELSA